MFQTGRCFANPESHNLINQGELVRAKLWFSLLKVMMPIRSEAPSKADLYHVVPI